MKTIIALALLVLGCSAPAPQGPVGPSDQDLEVAYEIAWEGVLNMPKEQRPRITWLAPCTGTPDVSTSAAQCTWSVWRPDGTADLQWGGKITASPMTFNQALSTEQWWINNPPPRGAPPDLSALNREIYNALLEAGL